MAADFHEIGSLFGREDAGTGFVCQTDKESFTYAFAWPEGESWATLTGYLNLDEQPEEYVRRVLEENGFNSESHNPDYDPVEDFKSTAGDRYRIPLLKVLLREQLASRYEVANHFATMNRARVEGYFTVISEPGSGAKAVDDIQHGIEPGGYDISVETRDMASGKVALAEDAPARDALLKDDQNIG